MLALNQPVTPTTGAICTDTSGNSSTTKTDWLGNDNTTFSNGDTMSCKTDWLGNYVCN